MIPLEDARLKANVSHPKPSPTCLLASVVPLGEETSVPRALLRDFGGRGYPMARMGQPATREGC